MPQMTQNQNRNIAIHLRAIDGAIGTVKRCAEAMKRQGAEPYVCDAMLDSLRELHADFESARRHLLP